MSNQQVEFDTYAEIEETYLSYGVVSFLAETAGFLSIILGFSFFNFLEDVINLLNHILPFCEYTLIYISCISVNVKAATKCKRSDFTIARHPNEP